ncbi:hypothetical protein QWY16_03410 [Planococcus shenhongbingii]|uniref:Uncharacterized protein n=1 Tax=Planococcus shenhongbingii TaxID=3058398 RepID=A0ABT8NE72_9BACL|nr:MULTISPECIES: hypothetical protein [unclassified Planococcus (in: firmicutes)]MDN7246207.1 hypothetical protein [Planococcus sp. N017]WKA59214.1 hypothetical protein QWY16_03410 [Planococcus sp. N016]
MKYLIDHATKTIHQRVFAGDRCGFTTTPIEKREFKDCLAYIESLQTQKGYTICPHCTSVQQLATHEEIFINPAH